MSKSIRFAAFLVVVAVASRIIPHWPNFTAVISLGLFSGLAFQSPLKGALLVLGTLIASDLVINYTLGYGGITWDYAWNYAPLMLSAFLGVSMASRPHIPQLLTGSVAATLLFFFISNLGVWAGSTLYGTDIKGLVLCYAAGLPFLGNMLAGSVFYGLIFLGAYRVVTAGSLRWTAPEQR
jgi:hypothetical protein